VGAEKENICRLSQLARHCGVQYTRAALLNDHEVSRHAGYELEALPGVSQRSRQFGGCRCCPEEELECSKLHCTRGGMVDIDVVKHAARIDVCRML